MARRGRKTRHSKVANDYIGRAQNVKSVVLELRVAGFQPRPTVVSVKSGATAVRLAKRRLAETVAARRASTGTALAA